MNLTKLSSLLLITLTLAICCTLTPVKAQTQGYLDGLKAYKKSNHQIMAGWFRMWRDSALVDKKGFANTLRNVPDSLDIVIAFGSNYIEKSKPLQDSIRLKYIPYLHARGTKVLRTGPNSLPATGYTHDTVGYKAFATFIIDSLVNKYGFDGYDIDIEDTLTGQILKDRVGIFKELSKKLGPASGSNKLLTYNTNQPAKGSGGFFLQTYQLMDYVFLQAYGRKVSSLQGTFNGYAPYIPSSKFVLGFSFYEENGKANNNSWNDVPYPDNNSGRCYSYARWQPSQGLKGGVVAYAIDRDVPTYTDLIVPCDWHVTRKIISQVMNPPATLSLSKAMELASYRITAGKVKELDSASAFTFESWINCKKLNVWNSVFSKSIGSANRVLLFIDSSGAAVANIGNGKNTNGRTVSKAIAANTWNHIALAYDGKQASDSLRLQVYINGIAQKLVFNDTIPSVTNTNSAELLLGSETASSTSTYFNGLIDEVRLWDTCLTNLEIAGWKNKELATCHPTIKHLILYWPLDSFAHNTISTALNGKYSGVFIGGPLSIASSQTPDSATCTPADFSSSKLFIHVGDSVTYSSLATNVLSYNWTFSGGKPATSTLANPIVTYDSLGTYTAKLVVTTASGADSITKVNYIKVSINTGVSDVSKNKILVYPNPVIRNSDLIFESKNNSQFQKLEIYDAIGNVILIINNIVSKYTIATTNLSKGIYFYRCIDDLNTSINGRFIVE